MLKGIDPLLSGDLLKVLDEMGHGDTVAVVDANYPAFSSGKPVISLGDVTVVRAIEAILGVFPLDASTELPLECMGSADGALTEAQQRVLELGGRGRAPGFQLRIVERFAFYEAARSCTAILRTLDLRPYGCFILHKGVIEDAEAGSRLRVG